LASYGEGLVLREASSTKGDVAGVKKLARATAPCLRRCHLRRKPSGKAFKGADCRELVARNSAHNKRSLRSAALSTHGRKLLKMHHLQSRGKPNETNKGVVSLVPSLPPSYIYISLTLSPVDLAQPLCLPNATITRSPYRTSGKAHPQQRCISTGMRALASFIAFGRLGSRRSRAPEDMSRRACAPRPETTKVTRLQRSTPDKMMTSEAQKHTATAAQLDCKRPSASLRHGLPILPPIPFPVAILAPLAPCTRVPSRVCSQPLAPAPAVLKQSWPQIVAPRPRALEDPKC